MTTALTHCDLDVGGNVPAQHSQCGTGDRQRECGTEVPARIHYANRRKEPKDLAENQRRKFLEMAPKGKMRLLVVPGQGWDSGAVG